MVRDASYDGINPRYENSDPGDEDDYKKADPNFGLGDDPHPSEPKTVDDLRECINFVIDSALGAKTAPTKDDLACMAVVVREFLLDTKRSAMALERIAEATERNANLTYEIYLMSRLRG